MLTVNVDPESVRRKKNVLLFHVLTRFLYQGNAESKKDQPLSPSKRSRASPSTPTHPSSDKIISPKSTSDESSASVRLLFFVLSFFLHGNLFPCGLHAALAK